MHYDAISAILHYVNDSADSRETLHDVRRRATRNRIVNAALHLTAEHGFDGFTVDELAAEADISRRTFFNYFPTKEDALFGGPDEFTEELENRFVTGGPSGRLMEDLVALFLDGAATHTIDPGQIRLLRAVLETEPKLIPMFRSRFAARTDKLVELIGRREATGRRTSAGRKNPRARLAVDILGSLVGRTIQQFADVGNKSDFDALLIHNVDEARKLLA